MAHMCHIAYAHELVLVAGSVRSLQRMLDSVSIPLKSSGLSVNMEKTSIFSWLKDGKQKRLIYKSLRAPKIRAGCQAYGGR